MARLGGEGRLGVVLVHGFTSSTAMWDPLRRLMAADPALTFADTLAFGYATRLWSWDPRRRVPSLDTVADSLKEFLDTEAAGRDRLIVVTHSQGGLVVQRWLTRMTAEGRGADLRRVTRVVMLACPNSGAEIALSLRRIALRRHPQELQLRPLEEQVADTLRIVLRDIVNASEVTARTCPIPFSVYAGESDNIVPPASARSVFPKAASLPGDHTGIARPTGPGHRTYTTLRRLFLLAADNEPPAAPSEATERPAVASSATGGTHSAETETHITGVNRMRGHEEPFVFPDVWELVAVAEQLPDMDDPAFRRTVVRQLSALLPPGIGFTVPSKEHPRDHLLEIIERCRAHADPRAALLAFRDAVTALRPDDAATAALRVLIREEG